MRPLLLALAAALPIWSSPALADAPAPQLALATEAQLDAYCDKLVDHYDRYGAGRNPHSDGKRNHTRIGAEIDCERGNHRDGIADMVDLLQDKKFRVPSPDPT